MSRTYGPVLMRCPDCGQEDYRTPKWVPAEKPLYKGDEVMQPEFCMVDLPAGSDRGFCGEALEVVHSGIACDLLPDDFTVDLGEGPRRFSSLSEVRAFEAESERKFRNGEGQPHIFRTFSQNSSNRHTNVFSGSSYERNKSTRPEKRTTGRGDQLPITVRPYRG